MLEGLMNDCEDNWMLCKDIECAKTKLESFYRLNYKNQNHTTSTEKSMPTISNGGHLSSPEEVKFT